MKFEIYTDGSYMRQADPKHTYGGFIVLVDRDPVSVVRVRSCDPDAVSAWNAGGELLAAIYGVATAYSLMKKYEEVGIEVDHEVVLYHDYNGVANFMVAPAGQRCPWAARKPVSKNYVSMMNSLAKQYPYTVAYKWIKGHSGDKWNGVADDIAGGRYVKHGSLPDLIEVEDK